MKEILQNISADFFCQNEPKQIEEYIESNFFSREVLQTKWLGYPPALQRAIGAKEQQLGIVLPPSYKAFLACSNGFRFLSPFLDNLLPVEKIDWAKNTETEWWFNLLESDPQPIADEDYFDYSENQDPAYFRGEYFHSSVKVSEWSNGMCIFLNPLIKHGDEWQVLEYATWHPGAQRFRSFRDYLQAVHKTNQMLISQRR
jgi:hypothetical protein